MPEHAKRELQLEDDIHFHKKEWAAQRVGRFFLFSFVIAAALGLFGSGLLSKKVSNHNSLTVIYEQFDRLQKSAFYEIQISPAKKTGNGQQKLWIGHEFLKNIRIEHITPEPSSVKVDGQGYTYTFETTNPNEALPIFFHFRFESSGKKKILLKANNADQVSLTQFVYP